MTQFRGVIEGDRGEAYRLASKASGLFVSAGGKQGKVQVTLHYEAGKGEYYRVTFQDQYSRELRAPIEGTFSQRK